jgi:prepilin-type N-terminal cleavage/methylation domain-containing protein
VKRPTPTEIALREAAGFRLLYIDGHPNWIKDCTLTVGDRTVPIEPSRITGSDGADTKAARPGFTLVELLVVIVIIAIVAAVTLPTVLPAITHRQISETARILQAAIEGSRDAAIRNNAPRGIRLLPDPTFPGSATVANAPLAFNRFVAIEPAGEYSEGRVSIRTGTTPAMPNGEPALRIEECQSGGGLANARTAWYWNARIGDKIRIGESGAFYTIVGPYEVANPERFVNGGPPGENGVYASATEAGSEVLFVVNGEDDDRDGFIDEGFDGVDQDVPPNGVDNPGEWEAETWLGPQAMNATVNAPYTIRRRPYPSPGARILELPSGVVIDFSSWDSTRERSRAMLDSGSMTVDIMIRPDGLIEPSTIYSSPASADFPFIHLFIAERGDVMDPIGIANVPYRLPMPEGTPGYPDAEDASPRYLKGERRILTINTRTGNITTGSAESFSGTNVNAPFYDAQRGIRDSP